MEQGGEASLWHSWSLLLELPIQASSVSQIFFKFFNISFSNSEQISMPKHPEEDDVVSTLEPQDCTHDPFLTLKSPKV